jgi:HlyD family secretion protein
MKRRFTRIISRMVLLGAVLALLATAVWFWLRPAPVTISTVTERNLSPAIQGVGTVEAKVVVQLAAKIPGRVIALKADQGDTVRKGQPLIELENSEARAEVERANANHERAKLAVPAQQAALLRAQAALSAADAAVARARANRTLAHANAERWRKLVATGDVPQMDVDARVTAAESADEELKSAEAQRQGALKDIAAQEAALKIAQNEIATAAAAVAAGQAKKADTLIVSPLDGFVVSRELEPGATVNPGTPILKLADPRTAWVTVFVDEREAGPIVVGDAADIALRSLPGKKLCGKVARIRRESDRVTEQLAVDITFDEPPPRLTLGEQAEATIRPAGTKAAAMPLAAVVRTPDGTGAWTVVEGRLQFRRARFGIVDPAGWIAVIEGFKVGEQVVLAPGKLADLSNEGRRVIAVSQTSDASAAEQP